MTNGFLLIVCGPSGVGKTSLCDVLLEQRNHLELSTSCTTRPPRGDEVDGDDYHFLDEDEFLDMVEDNEFAEWAEVHGHYYGTARTNIEKAWSRGNGVLFDIDYQGAKQLQDAYSVTTSALITPPSMEELERRLRERGTDSDDVIENRLRTARQELAHYDLFDYALVNDDFQETVSRLKQVCETTAMKTQFHRDHIIELIEEAQPVHV